MLKFTGFLVKAIYVKLLPTQTDLLMRNRAEMDLETMLQPSYIPFVDLHISDVLVIRISAGVGF